MDTHIEHLVRKKKDAKDRVKQLVYLVVGLFLTAVILPFAPYTMGIWIALIIGVWYGVYRFVIGLNKEFEYIVTNDELDVDVITAKRTRKHLISIRVREFMICAPIMDGRFDKEYLARDSIKHTLYAAADPQGEDAYFVDFHMNAERARLIFTPTEKMLKAMHFYNPRKIFLQENQ